MYVVGMTERNEFVRRKGWDDVDDMKMNFMSILPPGQKKIFISTLFSTNFDICIVHVDLFS